MTPILRSQRLRSAADDEVFGADAERTRDPRDRFQREILIAGFDALERAGRRPDQLGKALLGDACRSPNGRDPRRHTANESVGIGAASHTETIALGSWARPRSLVIVLALRDHW